MSGEDLAATVLDVYNSRESLWNPEHSDVEMPDSWDFLASGDAFVARRVKAAGVLPRARPPWSCPRRRVKIGKIGAMFVVHATKKLLDRLRPAAVADPETSSTTMLGSWYATVLFWRPQVALLVNEITLLPVLMPLAPAGTVLERFPERLAEVLATHGLSDDVIAAELTEMDRHGLAKTANRSVVGIMNEFSFLADAFREKDDDLDLVALSVRLAATPCGPLYGRHISPDRELTAWVRQSGPARGVQR